MTIRFTYTNLADTGTLTSNTAATAYPAINVQHPFKTKTYRSTGVTDEWLKWNLGSAQSVTMVAIINTNLTSAATVYFCGHASDLGNATANWHGTATVDETITIPASGLTIKYFTGASKQWWFLGVAPAGAGTYIEIGRVYFGSYYQPAQDFSAKMQHGLVDRSISITSIGGQKHSDIRDKFYAANIPFEYVTKTQKNELLSMFSSAGIHKDIIISFDPVNDVNGLSYYGKFSGGTFMPVMTNKNSTTDYHNVTLNFEESL